MCDATLCKALYWPTEMQSDNLTGCLGFARRRLCTGWLQSISMLPASLSRCGSALASWSLVLSPRPTNWDNYIRLSRDVHARLSNARLSGGLKLMLPPNSSSCLLYGFQTVWQMYKPIGTWWGSPSKQSHKQTLKHCSYNVISICLTAYQTWHRSCYLPRARWPGCQWCCPELSHSQKYSRHLWNNSVSKRREEREQRWSTERTEGGRSGDREEDDETVRCGGNTDGKRGKEMSAIDRKRLHWRATSKQRDEGVGLKWH